MKIKKGQETKQLPPGATVLLVLGAAGWHGSLSAEGIQVDTQSAGAMGILSKLARKWLAARGAQLTGKVQE